MSAIMWTEPRRWRWRVIQKQVPAADSLLQVGLSPLGSAGHGVTLLTMREGETHVATLTGLRIDHESGATVQTIVQAYVRVRRIR